MNTSLPDPIADVLRRGTVIPACPLALDSNRSLDERHQRAVLRYYSAAGAGGVAVGVHTTQFAIRDRKIGLFEPLLALAQDEFNRLDGKRDEPLVRIAGVCGKTAQAVGEAELIVQNGFHAGLLSLSAMKEASVDQLIAHCRAVADVVPLVGFYLQPAVGGRLLPAEFWRRFAQIENVVAIKVAPFNRYQTIDVVRGLAESGRDDVALYTGNDDNILLDLVTPYRIGDREFRFVGGLLGHWAAWTRRAVEHLAACHRIVAGGLGISDEFLRLAVEVTETNAALFDVANGFAGCIAGIHEILVRQGLLEGIWLLDPKEGLGPGQREEIERIYRLYPHLADDDFVAMHRGDWLR